MDYRSLVALAGAILIFMMGLLALEWSLRGQIRL